MPNDPLDDIFAEGQELSRRQFHETSQREAEKEEKARKRRRLLRAIILCGLLGGSAFWGLATLLTSDLLAVLALLCGLTVSPAFLWLLLMGGVAKPRLRKSFTKSARRRLRD